MMLAYRHLAAPLALFLALFFFAGFSLAPVISAAPVAIDQCCDKGADSELPDSDGECADCNCPTCQNILLQPEARVETLVSTTLVHLGLSADAMASGFSRAIDYPPESV